MNRYLLGSLALLGLLLLVVGCSSNATRAKKPIFMGLFGFNYTDRAVEFVRVDGNYLGGLSAFTNGGSSSMGRKKFNGDPVSIHVTWVEMDRYDLSTNSYVDDKHRVSRSADVLVPAPYSKDASTLLLHFLPGGSVEAELVQRDRDKCDLRRMAVPEGHEYHGMAR